MEKRHLLGSGCELAAGIGLHRWGIVEERALCIRAERQLDSQANLVTLQGMGFVR